MGYHASSHQIRNKAMQKKKVTMLDIATAVGVSQPTVSVILNGSDSVHVSEKTREKVIRKEIEE